MMRIGHGYDIHRLKSPGRLVLGGVCVSEQIGPVAHSDGDVAIHALVDAILGALGLGDIGEHFPNDDPRWRGCDSRVFLEHAMRQAAGAGLRVANADVTILCEPVRLKAHKPAMSRALRQILDAPVNIKAGTNEGCDAVGRGEAIAAHAVVLLGGT